MGIFIDVIIIFGCVMLAFLLFLCAFNLTLMAWDDLRLRLKSYREGKNNTPKQDETGSEGPDSAPGSDWRKRNV